MSTRMNRRQGLPRHAPRKNASAAVTPPADPDLRVDDRVMIEGGVQNTRVTRR